MILSSFLKFISPFPFLTLSFGLMFGCAAAGAAPPDDVVGNFALLDHRGKFHNLEYYSDQKAIVIVVQGNACPIVRKSVSYLNDLKKQFESQGVVFFMLNANSNVLSDGS